VAYDEGLADRVREHVLGPDVREQKLFGGLGVMVAGNMCVGVLGDELVVRVGPDDYELALARPGAREFDFTGRPMRGWVMVGGKGIRGESLAAWLDQALAFVRTLPPKGGSGPGRPGKGPGAYPVRS
jgi:hypothetical protein